MTAWQAVSDLCRQLGYNPGEVRYGGRERVLVYQRCQIAKSLRPHFSLLQLARGMGGRDHTTILYYLRREWPVSPMPPVDPRARLVEAGCGL